jgi:hypothetical protein
MRRMLCFLVVLSLLVGCTSNGTEYQSKIKNCEYLHRSMKAVTDRIVYDIFSPPVASRIYAYTSIAAYEALVPGDPRFISLAGQLHGLETFPQPEKDKPYALTVSSVQAALQVGRALIFSESELDKFYEQIMAEMKSTGIPNDVFNRSVEYGNKVANHVLKWADKDNYKQTRSAPKYTISNDPATWQPTPPGYFDGIEPHWNKIRTFVIDSAQQFKPEPPTPFSKEASSLFYKEAIEVYEIGKNLSNEQKEIASFWDCNPFVMNVSGHVMFATKKISPGGHWVNITRVACSKANADFTTSAEAYARVSIALTDAFISCWDEKYRSNLIRPETYINQYIDENWTPLLQTPPFPEYTSGHSVISSAAAVTLTKLFGDNFSFTDSTEVEFGLPARSFGSFLEASEEAAISRLYGGIHYRPAIDNGVEEGRALGYFIAENIHTRSNNIADNQ